MEKRRDSLVNLLLGTSEEPVRPKPPSAPKPRDRGTPLRRASYISPYLTSPKLCSRSAAQAKSGAALQGHRSRKSQGEVDDVDFAGKNVFDLREELITTCKSLRETKDERDGLKHEVMRLKSTVEKKEKEVEDLLVGGYVGQKDRIRMAGASTKQDSLLALSSLRHRVHILERNLRLKEDELLNLRKDIKSSRLKELEAEKEVYYTEITRLQSLTEKLQSELNSQVPHSKKHLRTKINELDKVIKKLRDRINKLLTENSSLKRQLGRWKEGGVVIDEHETDERKFLLSKYREMTQGQVIACLIDKEMRVQELDGRVQSLSEEQERVRNEYKNIVENPRVDWERMEKIYNTSKEIEVDKLKESITNLEEQVKELDKENTSLGKQCLDYRASVEKSRQELSDTTESLNSLQTDRNKMKSEILGLQEAQRNEEIAREHLRRTRARKMKAEEKNQFVQNQAASLIQRTWKCHISLKKQRMFEAENDRIASLVQSVLKSHHLRSTFLKQEEATAITCIQIVFRAHRTREIYTS